MKREHVKFGVVVLGLLVMCACGSEGGEATSPFGADSVVETWSVPDDLSDTADSLVATRGGLLLVGHDESELLLALRDHDSAQWSKTARISEGFGWQVTDTADGPVAVGAFCDKPSIDMVCETDALHLRAYAVSADGVEALKDGPHLKGTTVDGVDLQVAALGESVVVAVRSATDASTLYSFKGGVWGELGTIEPVRRMCATSDSLYIQSFIVIETPERPVVQLPTPSKTPPPDEPSGSVPGSASSTPAASVPVGGKHPLDSAANPLVVRTFDQDGLSASVPIGSTVDGSLDGEIGCASDRAEVMVSGEWESLAPPSRVVNAVRGTQGHMVLIGGESGQMPGYLEITDGGDVVVRVLDGFAIELPSNAIRGGSIIAAAHSGDATALLVSGVSSAGADADSLAIAPRLIAVVSDRQ